MLLLWLCGWLYVWVVVECFVTRRCCHMSVTRVYRTLRSVARCDDTGSGSAVMGATSLRILHVVMCTWCLRLSILVTWRWRHYTLAQHKRTSFAIRRYYNSRIILLLLGTMHICVRVKEEIDLYDRWLLDMLSLCYCEI